MLGKQNPPRILSIIIVACMILTGSSAIHAAETVIHTYDELNRLIQSTYSDGTTLIFEYDKLGNRITKKKLFKPHILTIVKSGTGTGRVTSTPQRIDCGGACSDKFSEGTSITLTEAPSGSSLFSGWSGGGCSGTGSCVLSVTADTTVSAIFQPCSNPSVKIGSTPYTSLQAAYNSIAAGSGATIKSQAVTLVEDTHAEL